MLTLKTHRSRAAALRGHPEAAPQGRRWAAACAALAAAYLAVLAPAAIADLSTASYWPMFRHEAQHTGRAAVTGPNTAAPRWRQLTGGSVSSSPSVFDNAGARKVWYFHGESWPGRPAAIPSTPADARPGLPPADPSPLPPFQALRSVAPDASLRALGTSVAAGTQVRLGIFETSAAIAGQDRWDPARESIPAGRWAFKFWARSRQDLDPTQSGQVRLFFKIFKFQQPLLGTPDDPDGAQRASLELFDTVDESATTAVDLAQFAVEKDVGAISLGSIVGNVSWGMRVEVWASNPTAAAATVRFDFEGDHPSRVATPAVDPCVYVGSDDGSLYAMNASTGDLHWSFAFQRASQALYLSDGTVAGPHGLASAPAAGGPTPVQTFAWSSSDPATLPAAITAATQANGYWSDVWPSGASLIGGKWRVQLTYRNTSSALAGTLYYRVLTVDSSLNVVQRLREWTQGPPLAVPGQNVFTTIRFDTVAIRSATLNGTERLYLELVSLPSPSAALPEVWELQADSLQSRASLPPLDRMRSSPAIDDEGTAYIGAEVSPDFQQGRLYAVNPDGTLKWVYPSDTQTVWFHPAAGSNWGALDYSDASTVQQLAQAATGSGANVFVQWRADSNAPNPPNAVTEATPSQALTPYGWLSSPAQVGLAGRVLNAGAWRLLLHYYATGTTAMPSGYVYYRISKVTLPGAGPPARVEELLGWTRYTDYSDPFTGRIRPGAADTVYTLDISTPEVTGTTFLEGEYVYVELYVRQVSPGDAGAVWVLSDTGGAHPVPPEVDTAGFNRVSPAQRLYLRALNQPAPASVPTTAQLTRSPGQTDDTATSVLTLAGSQDCYQFQPGVSNNSAFVTPPLATNLPGITQAGWIAEEPNLEGQELAAGSWRLRVRYSASDVTGSPEATLWYRISQVTVDSTPQIVRVSELLGWTASPTLAPTVADPSYAEITFDTPQVAGAALGPNEFLYIEYFLQPTAATTSARVWTLHVENDATWVVPTDLLTSPVEGISSSPAIAADDASTIVFADHGGRVYALDRSGQDRFDPVELPNLPPVTSSPAIAPAGSPKAGTLYVGDEDGFLYALDKDTGAILWQYPGSNPFGPITASPLVTSDGRIYIATGQSFDGTQNGRVEALDSDGNPVWAAPYSPTNPRAAPDLDDIRSSPAISFDGTTLYVGSDDGDLYAINAADGTAKWNYLAGAWDAANVPGVYRYPIRSSPAVAPGLQLYFHDDPAGSTAPQRLSSAQPTGNVRTRIASGMLPGTTGNLVQAFRTGVVALANGTSTGDPDVATLPAGTWSFVITAKLDPLRIGDTVDLKFQVWPMNGATGTPLTASPLIVSNTQALTSTFTRYTISGANPTSYQLDLTRLDYLEVDALADTSAGNTQPIGVEIRYDGNTGSRTVEPDLIYFGCDDGRVYSLADAGAVTGPLDVFVNDDDGSGTLNDPTDTGGWDPNWIAADPGAGVPLRSSPSIGMAPYYRTAQYYSAGTATATTGSPTVIGAGTQWTSYVNAGDRFRLNADGVWYTIASVDSPTQITLTANYANAGGSGAYTIEMGNARYVSLLYIGALDWQVMAIGLGPQGVISGASPGGAGGWAGSEGSLSKRASPTVVCGGAAVNPPDKQVTYTLRLQNNGMAARRYGLTGTAGHLALADKLPYGVTVVPGSITPPGQQIGNSVIWNFDTQVPALVLGPGQGVTVQYTAEVIASFNGTDPDSPQPTVAVANALPAPESTQPSDGPKSFVWGDQLYLWVKGRGAPAYLSDRAVAAWTDLDLGFPGRAVSREVTVKVGWGDRYKVTLSYDSATDPDGATLPNNQTSVTLEMDLTRTAVARHTGASSSEVYESGEPGRITIVRWRIWPTARGDNPSLPTNSPWTPYYWKATIQQSRCAAQGLWSDPWGRLDSGNPSIYDVFIQNPLNAGTVAAADGTLSVPSLGLPAGGSQNPGSNTGWGSFGIRNMSRFPLQAAPLGAAVRWQAVDLGQSTVPFNPPGYDARLENYFPEHLLSFSPSDSLGLGAGQTGGVSLWAEVPHYLSPGSYAAPSAVSPAKAMRIYADLNGNRAWDPGEAFFEDTTGTPPTYSEFTLSINVASDPLLAAGYETADIGKHAQGWTPSALYAVGSVQNLGNLALPAVGLADPIYGTSYVPMERSDLPLAARRPNYETTPLVWEPGAISMPGSVAKTPVRGAAATAEAFGLNPAPTPPASSALSEGQPAGSGPGLPTGTYVGLLDLTATVTDPILGGSLTASAPARLAVRVTEQRLTGELGADIMPAAAFVGNDALTLFWSSNRRADAAAPGPDDPYYLYFQTLTRDRTAAPWTATWSALGGPYPGSGSDYLDTPAAPTRRGHQSPGLGVDASGHEWLYWSGWGLRPGPQYDARLLWTDLTAGGSIMELPSVSSSGAEMSSAFKIHPAPLGWSFATILPSGLRRDEYILKAVWGEGGGSAWQLMLYAEHRKSTRQNVGDPWTVDPAGFVGEVTPIKVSRDLSDVRDPCAFPDPTGSGLVDIAFTARSGQEGNHDIYLARYNPALLSDPLTYGEAPFGVLTDRLTALGPSNSTFTARHRRWAENLYAVGAAYVVPDPGNGNQMTRVIGVGTFWLTGVTPGVGPGVVPGDRIRFGTEAASYIVRSVDNDTQLTLQTAYTGGATGVPGVAYSIGPVRIYVGAPDQAPSAGAEIGGTVSAYDATAGRYLISNSRYGTVEVYPDLGLVNFRDNRPAGDQAVTVSYAPRLMRLTTSPRDDLTPAAFVETYRYRDATGLPQPAGFVPRLWMFSTRLGGEQSASRVYLQTFRQGADPSGNLSWLPETRGHSPYWSVDVSETIVPIEHAANEFGLAAAKDPALAQVWLFWSSTRGISAGPGVAPTQNSDVYYTALNPALPE